MATTKEQSVKDNLFLKKTKQKKNSVNVSGFRIDFGLISFSFFFFDEFISFLFRRRRWSNGGGGSVAKRKEEENKVEDERKEPKKKREAKVKEVGNCLALINGR